MDAVLGMKISSAQRAIAASVAGTMAYTQGDVSASERYLLEGLEMARRVGDQVREVHCAHGLGLIEMDRRNLEEARTWFQASTKLYQALGNESMLSLASTQLGTLLLTQGEYASARAPMQQGLAMARRTGDRLSTCIALYNLAQIDLALGNNTAAVCLLQEGIDLSEQKGDQANLAYFLESMAIAKGNRGEAERAARLLGAAQAQFEAVGAPVYNYYLPDRALYERVTTAIRTALGDAKFEAARTEGRQMPREHVTRDGSG
jgi:tetratricopeptide (TPR) repeat protein